ncbi:MAG: hypothetical protein QXF82_02855 [Nitrososphaeria archaeon]
MKHDFNDLILENLIHDIERYEKRLIIAKEFLEKAKSEGKETKGYDLAKEEYKKQIKNLIEKSSSEIKVLEEYEDQFKEDKEKMGNEKLKN